MLKIAVCKLDIDDLDVLVRIVDPILDGVLSQDAGFDPSAIIVQLAELRVICWKIANLSKSRVD
jgi:hypothetical protein